MSDHDDEEARWCDEERRHIIDYLAREGLTHGGVGEWPAWHMAPKIAVWAVQSVARPGWVGWWAVSGDLPCDYCTASQPAHPRKALRAISESWSAMLSAMKPGDPTIGDGGLPPHLAPLLRERADLLRSLAEDDRVWLELDD